MAYNQGDRFEPPPKWCMLLEPAAYQRGGSLQIKPNKAPFLSKTPRDTTPKRHLWTHAIYDTAIPYSIKNCSTLQSKCPRFPYEAFNKEDLEILLCQCGIEKDCDCPTEEENPKEIVCHAQVRKKLFTGPVPKTSVIGAGLSSPSIVQSPPFYDSTITESTAYYHGCKWSKSTSKRSIESFDKRPGPADYYFAKIPTEEEIRAENFRFSKRKDSRQMRFIEMVQQRDLLEGRPGPATYNPNLPEGYKMKFSGAKSKRFLISTIERQPGPADHFIKRIFDPLEPPNKQCQVKLPLPSFFGVKALRFKPQKEEGPSPATYKPIFNTCNFLHCPTAAFGSSSQRFKECPIEQGDSEVSENAQLCTEKENVSFCQLPSWQYKSKTVRIKPLLKNFNAPSPADLPQSSLKVDRSQYLQSKAPFLSSEGRFRPWKDWMPVFGQVETPGPCYYDPEKPKCYPAVTSGPVSRSNRFSQNKDTNPSPNNYIIDGGIDNILKTHNQILKDRIKQKPKLKWKPRLESTNMSYEEQEALLLNKSIALLDTASHCDKID